MINGYLGVDIGSVSTKGVIIDKNSNILAKSYIYRNVVVFDVVMEYLDRNPEIKKGKHPVNVTLKTRYTSYDIIAIKEEETEKLYEEIDTISNADKIIIIIETKNYIKMNCVNMNFNKNNMYFT